MPLSNATTVHRSVCQHWNPVRASAIALNRQGPTAPFVSHTSAADGFARRVQQGNRMKPGQAASVPVIPAGMPESSVQGWQTLGLHRA